MPLGLTETKLETKIADLENMQEARRANWRAEEARIESLKEARRAFWHVEESGRNAKIAELKAKLLAKRDGRIADETKEAARLVAVAESKARYAAFVEKTKADAAALCPPPLIRASVKTAPPPLMLPPLPK